MRFNSELVWTGISQLVQFFGGILVFKLMTTLLTKNDYGTYSLFIAISAFVVAMPFSAVMQGIVKYIPEMNGDEEKERLLRVFFTLFSCVILIYAFVGFLVTEFNYSFGGNTLSLFLFVIFDVFKSSIYTAYNGLRKRKIYAFLVSFEYILRLLLLLVVFFFLEANFQYAIFAFIIPSALVAAFSAFSIFGFTMRFSHEDFANVKKVVFFSFPLIIWALFGWARDMGIRAYIEALLTREELAAFTAISSLAVIVPTVLGSFISMYILPILYEKELKFPGNARSYVKKLLKYGFLFIIVFGICINEFSINLVEILASSNYVDNADYFALLFVGQSLFTISMMMTVEIYCYNKTKLLIFPNVMSGLISIGVGYALVSKYGIDGAFFASFFSYVSYFLFTFFVCYKFKPVVM
ncbi:TPA: hypothetical protein P0E18_001947 [Vibrio harveyi]|nr:hypothetical protein [Vibrio harveyi]